MRVPHPLCRENFQIWSCKENKQVGNTDEMYVFWTYIITAYYTLIKLFAVAFLLNVSLAPISLLTPVCWHQDVNHKRMYRQSLLTGSHVSAPMFSDHSNYEGIYKKKPCHIPTFMTVEVSCSHLTVIWTLSNGHIFTTNTASQSHVINISVLPNLLVTSRINAECRRKISSCGHMIFHLLSECEVMFKSVTWFPIVTLSKRVIEDYLHLEFYKLHLLITTFITIPILLVEFLCEHHKPIFTAHYLQ